MIKYKKILSTILIVSGVLLLNPSQANAAWKQNSTGWWYAEGNSWATGWKLIDGSWYYFYSDGYMAKNTTIDGYYLNSSGAWSKPSSSENMTSEKALAILKNAYPDYTYVSGGELNTYYLTGEDAYRFTFRKGNDIYIGWVLMDGSYSFRYNNSIY